MTELLKSKIVDDISPESEKPLVWGQGNLDPILMVIGEAPGQTEEATGTPFIGKSGALLRAQLTLAGVDPLAIYYTNVVKVRPRKDRTPKPDEIIPWLDTLKDEVIARAPLHVILAGKVAQLAWEQIQQDIPFPLAVHRITHPAAVLRNRRNMPAWKQALHDIGQRVNGYEQGAVEYVGPDEWWEGEPDWSHEWLAADTETAMLENEVHGAELVSIQYSDGQAAELRWPQPTPKDVPHLYLHNAKYDAKSVGIDLYDLARWDDTALMAYVLRYPRVGLKVIGPEVTGIDMVEIKEILTEITKNCRILKSGKNKGKEKCVEKKRKRQFDEAIEHDYERAKDYALRDAVVTSRLAQKLVPQLQAQPRLWTYYQEIEKPIVPILYKMEQEGVLIDTAQLEPIRRALDESIAFHDDALRAILRTDESFNPRSNEQLAEAFQRFGIPLVTETKGGAISVAEKALLDAIGEVDLEKIDESTPDERTLAVLHTLRGREYGKLRTTYVDRLLNDRDWAGRVHGSFNQMVAATNRFSASNPNLQNIPARTNIGTEIRKAFIARPGYSLVKTDFSALEVRIYAHLTNDAAMRRAFEQGISPHDLNAERFGDGSSEFRKRVKNWYFAVIYGAEVVKAAMTVGLSIEEAWAMMRKVREESPAIMTWPKYIENLLIQQGYVETIFGWREYYPHHQSPIPSESAAAVREAANMPVQGSASGIIKKFMIAQDAVAQDFDSVMVLQVHDETVVEVPNAAVRDFVRATVDVVRGLGGMGVGFSVPLEVEVKVGNNWASGKTYYKEGRWLV